jgi:hypothetical protein
VSSSEAFGPGEGALEAIDIRKWSNVEVQRSMASQDRRRVDAHLSMAQL